MEIVLTISLVANLVLLYRLFSERANAWAMVIEARRLNPRHLLELLAKYPADFHSFQAFRPSPAKKEVGRTHA